MSCLLPGYTFLALSGFSKGKSDFQVALQSVWGSLVVHLLYTLPLFLHNSSWLLQANSQLQRLLEDKSTPFVKAPDQYIRLLAPHWDTVILLVLGPFVLAGVLGLVTSWLRRRFELDLDDRTDRTIFHKVLRQFWKEKTAPMIQVTLSDGPTYWGTVVLGSYEGNKEIIIGDVYVAKGEEDDPEPVEGFVYLKLDNATDLRLWETSNQKVLERYAAQQSKPQRKRTDATATVPQTKVAAAVQTPGDTAGN